ncbi:PREDICTED: polygalacturonase [Prunus dulcis]|uniref:PREDICTED: polygalacturonase n=1 Tax=Prunus dulcis TaxID=3755 RepID=A0A5E4FZ12_PRUDU|nr:PREDICTED: polygalacturonase [Prunus dulcis]
MPPKFVSYRKTDSANQTEFSSYAEDANIIGSGFTGYRESGTGQKDSFKGYDQSANNPHSNFKSYGGDTSGVDGSSNYQSEANVGDDSFQSHARNSNSEKLKGGDERERLKEKWVLGTNVRIVEEEKKEEEEGWGGGDAGFGVD